MKLTDNETLFVERIMFVTKEHAERFHDLVSDDDPNCEVSRHELQKAIDGCNHMLSRIDEFFGRREWHGFAYQTAVDRTLVN